MDNLPKHRIIQREYTVFLFRNSNIKPSYYISTIARLINTIEITIQIYYKLLQLYLKNLL